VIPRCVNGSKEVSNGSKVKGSEVSNLCQVPLNYANFGREFLMETTWNFKPMMVLVYWRVQYAGYSLLCDNQHVLVLGLGLELILLDDAVYV